jgi:hypothetical protein
MPVPGFPWVSIDNPEQILGHHRPTSFKELVNAKHQYWRDLYRSWLPQSGGVEGAVAAFDFIRNGGKSAEWDGYLKDAEFYGRFYNDVGALKEALRHPPEGQVPQEPEATEVPSTWEDLTSSGTWWQAYLEWLRTAAGQDDITNFFQAVEAYRLEPSVDGAREIFDTHIRPGSEQQVNVDDAISKQIADAVADEQATPELFDQANQFVIWLLQEQYPQNHYPRFRDHWRG